MWQSTLFNDPLAEPRLRTLDAGVQRRHLGDGAWVDLRPDWLSGSAQLMERLLAVVPWRAEKRQMYDRVVAVPRLTHVYHATDVLPDEMLLQARADLTAHYRPVLPEGFATAGMCLYRDGNDSVAWHGDTIGRGKTEDTLVAIVSLGSARTLSLRPRSSNGSRHTLKFTLGPGDLIVMGGSCQRTWEHAILKAPAAGPRISVQFRPEGVF